MYFTRNFTNNIHNKYIRTEAHYDELSLCYLVDQCIYKYLLVFFRLYFVITASELTKESQELSSGMTYWLSSLILRMISDYEEWVLQHRENKYIYVVVCTQHNIRYNNSQTGMRIYEPKQALSVVLPQWWSSTRLDWDAGKVSRTPMTMWWNESIVS